MEGGILLYRLVRLPEGRVADIEKHGTEAIGDARVTGEKSIDCKGRWRWSVGCKLLICGVVDCRQHFAVLLFLHLSHLQHFYYETGIYYPPKLYKPLGLRILNEVSQSCIRKMYKDQILIKISHFPKYENKASTLNLLHRYVQDHSIWFLFPICDIKFSELLRCTDQLNNAHQFFNQKQHQTNCNTCQIDAFPSATQSKQLSVGVDVCSKQENLIACY